MKNLTAECIHNTENGIFSEEELIAIASAIGTKISDSIFDDFVGMSMDYVNPENIVNLDLQDWICKRNPVLTQFLMSIAKCNDDDYKKKGIVM